MASVIFPVRHCHEVLLYLVVVAHLGVMVHSRTLVGKTNFKVSWGGGVGGGKENFEGIREYVKGLIKGKDT